MVDIVHIKTFLEHDIYLNPSSGEFLTTMDDTLRSDSLKGVEQAMMHLREKETQKTRSLPVPVQVAILLSSSNDSHFELWEGKVRGIVAGNTFYKKLRTDKGQIGVPSSIACAHPQDSRLERIREMCALEQVLMEDLNDIRTQLRSAQSALTRIAVPACPTKADAIDMEPIFLGTLRVIPPQAPQET